MNLRFIKMMFILLLLLSSGLPAVAKSIRPVPLEKQVVTAAPLADQWQFFRINAQYRGTIKKSYSNLGCAIAWFNDLTPDRVQVIIHVCALNPEKRHEKYAFRLNLVLQRGPTGYSLVSREYADFTGITGDRQNQLQQLAALWTYMRDFSHKPELRQKFDAGGAGLRLSEVVVHRGKGREVNCTWPARRGFNGKFFFERAVDPAFKEVLYLDKLRFKSGRLSVSLVQDTQQAITRDFATREPFNTDVFR